MDATDPARQDHSIVTGKRPGQTRGSLLNSIQREESAKHQENDEDCGCSFRATCLEPNLVDRNSAINSQSKTIHCLIGSVRSTYPVRVANTASKSDNEYVMATENANPVNMPMNTVDISARGTAYLSRVRDVHLENKDVVPFYQNLRSILAFLGQMNGSIDSRVQVIRVGQASEKYDSI